MTTPIDTLEPHGCKNTNKYKKELLKMINLDANKYIDMVISWFNGNHITEMNKKIREYEEYRKECQKYKNNVAQPLFDRAFDLARDVFIFLSKNKDTKVQSLSLKHEDKNSFIQKTIEEIKNTPFNAKTFAANPKNRKHVENISVQIDKFYDLDNIYKVNSSLKTSVNTIDDIINLLNNSIKNPKDSLSKSKCQDLPDHYSLFFKTACRLILEVDECIRKLQQEIKEKEDELKRLKLMRKR